MGCVHQHYSDSSESFFLVRGGYSRVNMDMDMSVSMEHGTGYHGTGTREATVINKPQLQLALATKYRISFGEPKFLSRLGLLSRLSKRVVCVHPLASSGSACLRWG